MRDAGCRVIWTRQTVSDAPPLAMPAWQYDLTDPLVARAVAVMHSGTASQDIHPAMARAADDIVIDKYRYGAFSCPAGMLHRTLQQAGIELLVLVGTLTNVCVESTAREGNMRGYKVIVVPDACATVTDAEHNAALLNLRLNFADLQSAAELSAATERVALKTGGVAPRSTQCRNGPRDAPSHRRGAPRDAGPRRSCRTRERRGRSPSRLNRQPQQMAPALRLGPVPERRSCMERCVV
ncbi:MAG: cysteine hydrolase [Mesorhizobium sp.]